MLNASTIQPQRLETVHLFTSFACTPLPFRFLTFAAIPVLDKTTPDNRPKQRRQLPYCTDRHTTPVVKFQFNGFIYQLINYTPLLFDSKAHTNCYSRLLPHSTTPTLQPNSSSLLLHSSSTFAGTGTGKPTD